MTTESNAPLGDAVEQFAYLYTREEASVHISVHRHFDGCRVSINGPLLAQAVHQFPTLESAEAFVTRFREQIAADGFRLQASAERRVNPRRSQKPEGTQDRRRTVERFDGA